MDLALYKYKTELHAHTSPCSNCSEMTPEDVVTKYKEINYDSIVICNHFCNYMAHYDDKTKALKAYLDDYYKTHTLGKEYGLSIILGCEIRFEGSSNDYLLFGIEADDLYDCYDYIEKDVESFSKWFRNDKRVFIQAHPFRDRMTRANPELIDGIETFNFHPNHNSRCSVAAKYAAEHDMLVTCGTDFHHDGHQGQIALLTKEPVTDSHKLAEILKSRDYIFETGNSIILPYKKPEP